MSARAATGLQLYSVRESFEPDPDATLKRIAATGIRIVEPYTFVGQAQNLRGLLERHGMSAPVAHANLLSDTIEYQGRTVQLPPVEFVIAEASTLGATTIIDPMVVPARWADEAEVEATAQRLNEAARLAARSGIAVGYHNHSFEFHQRFGNMSAYDFFVGLLDPEVELELDLYWAAVAGQDLAALVDRHSQRIRQVHVKDGRVTPDPFRDGIDGYATASIEQSAAGTGDVDIAGAIAAAGDLRFAVIEFDRFDGDVFEAVAETSSYLDSLAAS